MGTAANKNSVLENDDKAAKKFFTKEKSRETDNYVIYKEIPRNSNKQQPTNHKDKDQSIDKEHLAIITNLKKINDTLINQKISIFSTKKKPLDVSSKISLLSTQLDKLKNIFEQLTFVTSDIKCTYAPKLKERENDLEEMATTMNGSKDGHIRNINEINKSLREINNKIISFIANKSAWIPNPNDKKLDLAESNKEQFEKRVGDLPFLRKLTPPQFERLFKMQKSIIDQNNKEQPGYGRYGNLLKILEEKQDPKKNKNTKECQTFKKMAPELQEIYQKLEDQYKAARAQGQRTENNKQLHRPRDMDTKKKQNPLQQIADIVERIIIFQRTPRI